MTTTCPACGSATSSSTCSRCGFVAPTTPVVLAKSESSSSAADTALFDATVARAVVFEKPSAASGTHTAGGWPIASSSVGAPAASSVGAPVASSVGAPTGEWPTGSSVGAPPASSVGAPPASWPTEQVPPAATGAPVPEPWESAPPPWQGAPGPYAAPTSTSKGSTVAAHLVLWLGLLLVAVSYNPLANALYRSGPGSTMSSILLGVLDVLPFAIAVVIAARSGTLRLVALLGAVAMMAVSAYETTRAYEPSDWPLPLALCVVGLATWMVARRHARTGYLLLVPAGLVLLLWFPSFGPAGTIQAFAYTHGVTSTTLLYIWSDLPIVVTAGFGLVSSLLKPTPARERDALGWAVVGPLVLVLILLIPITRAISSPGYSPYTGSADYSGSTPTPDYTSATVDPVAAATAYLDAAQAGQSSVAGCNGDVATPSIASYTIGQVSPATSGGFDVSADVIAADGSTSTITVHIGPTAGPSGQSCVESATAPDYTASTGSDQAGSGGFPVPSVPSAGDPVPVGGTIPDGTVGGTVIPYTDTSQTPTTSDELVAYQPTGLSGDETAAVQALIRFLTAINQQDFQSAWNSSTYVTKASTYTSGFAGGYVTSRHYEVSFGQPQVLASNLIAVPATFVSRQDPAAQGNPSGVTGCTYWPQYVFLAANVNGTWLDDVAGIHSSDPSVVALKRADPSRPGKVALNPLSQRIAC